MLKEALKNGVILTMIISHRAHSIKQFYIDTIDKHIRVSNPKKITERAFEGTLHSAYVRNSWERKPPIDILILDSKLGKRALPVKNTKYRIYTKLRKIWS